MNNTPSYKYMFELKNIIDNTLVGDKKRIVNNTFDGYGDGSFIEGVEYEYFTLMDMIGHILYLKRMGSTDRYDI